MRPRTIHVARCQRFIMRGAAVVSAAILMTSGPVAQDRPLGLAGHWRLVEPTAKERARDTLIINAARELLVTQTPLVLIVEHPSKPGTHPEAGVFEYGIGGTVGGSPNGGGPGADSNWGV